MKVIDCEQGSIQWQRLRMGRPTASQFHRILTPGGKRSTQCTGYMRHLIAELMIGSPIDSPKTSWMDRGHDLEGEAIAFYEFERNCETQRVGIILNDAETIGASPDSLIGDDGLLEIKCPSPQVHVGYMLYNEVEADYWVQLQGQLYIAERQWTDICSYHPALPAVIVRVERDEEYIAKLADELDEFVAVLQDEILRLKDKGYKFREQR